MANKLMHHESLQKSTPVILVTVWKYLTLRRRFQLLLLLAVMCFSGAAELLSLGAVLPFLTVFSAPEILWRYEFVEMLAKRFGWSDSNQLLLPAVIVFVVAVLFAAMVRLINLWFNGRLAAAIGSDLSCDAYRRTLYQPYDVHVRRNSSIVITNTTTQIGFTVVAFNALLQAITSAVVAFGLLIGLLLIDANAALSVAVIFGTAYGLLIFITRRELQSNGQKITTASNKRLQSLQEGLGAIRDVLLDSSQSTYLKIYQHSDRHQRRLEAKNNFLANSPRFALEALGMVAIALLGLFLVVQRGNASTVLPLLGVLALGAQRLLPALQQIYRGWASLKSYNSAMNGVVEMLQQPIPTQNDSVYPLLFSNNVELSGVVFRYGPGLSDILKDVKLKLIRGERVGIIGSTGSGKSTLIDLLMGLLRPTSGSVLVDGVDLRDPSYPNIENAWRAAIAHVPQSIYLADSSFAENIAFGVPKNEIDFQKVVRAAKQACIHEFIESKPNGYYSSVGERGVQLSGGQRQRIGIARALYKNCQVLVLDEATSALDTTTEQSVMESIEGLGKDLTIVIIAHRISTVLNCDRLIKLAHGRIISDGPPSSVLSSQ